MTRHWPPAHVSQEARATKVSSSIGIDSGAMRKHRPRAKNIAARVAMNGCTSKTCTIAPTRSPMSEPTSTTSGITTPAGTPARSRYAAVTPDSASTEPTERSMPPVRMTNVIPTASTMRNALLMNRFASTPTDRKLS